MWFKMKITKLFALILSMLLFTSCYKRELTRGPEYTLYVFAENQDWQQAQPILTEVFQRSIMTPQTESHFNLVHVNPDSFQYFLVYKQLLFLASLESEGKIADIVKRAVGEPEKTRKVQSGESFLFKIRDQWAGDQLSLILTSTTIPNLIQLMQENKELVYETMLEHQQAAVEKLMYRRPEKKEVSDNLLENYLFTLKIQHDYKLAIDDPEGKFIFLRRTIPERWMFIKWFEDHHPDDISKEWYFEVRDSVGVQYYGGDSVNREYTKAEESEFLGKWCLKITGLWENEEKVAGGPILAYIFYDIDARRTYVIDCSVFAPNQAKIQYLDQLDIMARTFKTKLELQKEVTSD